MHKIAIVSDTDCSLPPELVARYGIRLVPITIHFGQEMYTTGVDIDDPRLFEIVDRLKQLPTTSAPSPGAFVSVFTEAFQQGAEAILCVCVSSKVSATYGSAVTACDSFPGKEIRVIDSLNLSMGQGFMVLAAAEAVRNGASAAEAAAKVEELGKRIHVYAVLSTLKYLALSGRVGKLAAGMADTLNIKPILTVQEGKLEMLEKIRTRTKAIARMLELVSQALNGKQVEQVAIIQVNNRQGAAELEPQLCAQLNYHGPVLTADFTPGLSVHGGSGIVGVVVVEKFPI